MGTPLSYAQMLPYALLRKTGYYASFAEQQAIEAKFPDLQFDWLAINRALARGDRRDPTPPGSYLAWADVEHLLRRLARREREHEGLPSEIRTLEAAAERGARSEPSPQFRRAAVGMSVGTKPAFA